MNKTEEEWKECLTPEQYEVLRRKGTEAAFTGKYYKNKETGMYPVRSLARAKGASPEDLGEATSNGMYVCGACGQELFSSETKFDSGTGWPSFTDPVNRENVELKTDTGHGMIRTEVLCKKCGSHLGHVFPDGPKDRGGQRYCINSLALDFKKKQ